VVFDRGDTTKGKVVLDRGGDTTNKGWLVLDRGGDTTNKGWLVLVVRGGDTSGELVSPGWELVTVA
jgi:hypothetical protein